MHVKGISPALDGTYIIHDTMNQRIKRGIDLLVGKNEEFYGKWSEVRISPVAKRTEPEAPARTWQAG